MSEPLFKKFPWLAHVSSILDSINKTLIRKEESYEGSWQRRGGVGAFMMLARKFDRIESQSEAVGFDIFKAVENSEGTKDGIEDDIDDLIGYLVLVRAETTRCRLQRQQQIRQECDVVNGGRKDFEEIAQKAQEYQKTGIHR